MSIAKSATDISGYKSFMPPDRVMENSGANSKRYDGDIPTK